jgi:riboflavin kinase/FMN adenylyltransferase
MTMRYKPEITWHGAPIQGAALAIGIFDGVHIGHQEILKEAMTSGLPVVALTFDPHPTSVFAPTKVPTRLLTLHNRIHQLAMHGATTTAIIKFTEEFSQLTPEEFISEVLVPTFDPQLVVVGENFTFGSKAAGNVEFLKQHAQFSVKRTPLLHHGNATVSSSRIREAIKAGNLETANQLLTRPHQLVGPVIHGEKRGRTIGYPTANIGLDSLSTIPSDGVYAGWLSVGTHRWPAAISIGTNPTFEGVRGRQVEAYALDRDDLDLYDQEATVEFGWRLRDTIKFSGLDELLAQMKIDCDEARKLTHSHA